MRFAIAAVAACSLFASVALAQDSPAQNMPAQDTPARLGPANAVVKSMHDNNSAAPVAGANSFTRAEAKSAIEAKGYTHVTKLKKDKHGVWRARATKDGQSGPVSMTTRAT